MLEWIKTNGQDKAYFRRPFNLFSGKLNKIHLCVIGWLNKDMSIYVDMIINIDDIIIKCDTIQLRLYTLIILILHT